MTFDEYQAAAMRTAKRAPGEEVSHEMHLAVMALGLTGEAGEVADMIKKSLGHGHGYDVDELRKELGDVLWYLTALAEHCGIDLEWIAKANVEKLQKRYPNGFSHEASRNRVAE